MGYREVKEKTEEKSKRIKCVVTCILTVVLVVFAVFSCFIPPESWKYHFAKPKLSKRKEGELRIHYVDVGQGDCTLIELPDGQIALIDGGKDDATTKKKVLRYLNALKIQKIDHLIVTHTDGDHCGSLEEVFRYKRVLNAYMPATFETKDIEFAEVYEAATKSGCTILDNSRSIHLSQDSETPYTFTFLYPYAEEALESTGAANENSAVLWLDYFGVSALFCGDSPASVEERLMLESQMGLFKPRGVDLSSTEILKVSHHGSSSASTKEFLRYLNVKEAIISCGKNNAYNHPAKSTLNNLSAVGAKVYRTDTQGNIVVTVQKDGKYRVNA